MPAPRIYLFDDRRWFQGTPSLSTDTDLDDYASKLAGTGITDLIVLVCGHFKGGTMGWSASVTPHIGVYNSGTVPIPSNHLAACITAMNAVGINVTAAINTTLVNWMKDPDDNWAQIWQPHPGISNPASLHADIHDAAFRTWIADVAAELAKVSGLEGILFDFTRTEHYDDGGDLDSTERALNDSDLELLMEGCYDAIKAENSNLVVSSWGGVWYDTVHTDLAGTGRKQIVWANAGYLDIAWDGGAGNSFWHQNPNEKVGLAGNPPQAYFIEQDKAALNDPTKLGIMPQTYTNNDPLTSSAGYQWLQVLNSMKNGCRYGFYTSFIFDDDPQLAQLTEYLRLHRRGY